MKYIERTRVEAEKFSGAFDTKAFKKYGIAKHDMNPDYFIETRTGSTRIKSGDWIVTYSDGDRQVVDDSEFKKSYRRVDKDIPKKRIVEPMWVRLGDALINLNNVTSVQEDSDEAGIVVHLSDGRSLYFTGGTLKDFGNGI